MRLRSISILVLLAALMGSLALPVQARSDRHERREQAEREHENKDRHGQSRQGILTRDEAARRAQREYGGRVLSVDLMQREDAPARYRVKLLSDGNVRTVTVDALED